MLSDKQLLGRLSTLCKVGRRIDVSVVLLLIEVEDRRLDLQSAYSSLYEFCRQELGMSEGTTHRRVEAARLVRRIPKLVEHLKRGTVTLSALALLKNHLTETNYEDLIARVAGKTRKQIELLIAQLSPRPDVVAQLRKLPARAASSPTQGAAPPAAEAVEAVEERAPTIGVETPALADGARMPTVPEQRRARLEPLAPARWKLQLTAGQELHDKLERLQSLMRHKNPNGDLAVIVEAAVDLLLEELEKTRRTTDGPSTAKARAIKAGAVSAATRRAVFQRDGERCTYVDAEGRRCGATTLLEIDHIDARGKGGSGALRNLRVRCRAHNKLHAEQTFGRAHIARRIAQRTSNMEATAAPESGSDSSSLEVERERSPRSTTRGRERDVVSRRAPHA